ncbi:uncharacterized protein [Rutidosis leptorrhynchoides]|uniref:uncharacterized protein n=1 Tax=Rutidosis leptorrhynchoides TaxID=125765 RepID=UPI003A99CBD7
MKKTKLALKTKSFQKFGNLEGDIQVLKSIANSLELKAEKGTIDDVERRQWLDARKEWFQKEKIKVNMLKQKARARWILEGDENSRYFHSMIKRGYNKNNIRGLSINGVWCENPSDIKEAAYHHFKSRFEDLPGARPSLVDLTYPTLSPEEANELEAPISESKIVEAIHDCGCLKAPGPDGEFSKGCNASFVTLIPKTIDPITLNDYRPISLIGSFYKIVAKILSNRLRKVIPRLVGSEQSAFLKDRYILDGVLIANESIEYLKNQKKRSLVFKVDFENAFDSLNWDFLMEVMSSMGFGSKWCRWILACLKSASISILINGSPTTEFSMGRGVRQGDPLSPFLFILAAEGLNILTKATVDRGIFKGVEIGNDKVVISHLQYADDTIFFGDLSMSNARNLIYILKCFELASGLKVNFHKSCLYGVGADSGEIDMLANRMGCQACKFPFIYLGLPIGAKMKKISDWNSVIEKFKKRLSEWKMRTLSFGGRLVLLKSVLNSLPLYYLALFRAPPCVLKLLESVRRIFFLGGDFSGSKISWVKWAYTCLPYGAGGLNIGSLKGKNLALLGKWWWRFKIETNCLWTKIIRSIYGIDGGLRSGVGLAHLSASGIWYNIILVGNNIEDCQVAFKTSFKKSIGDGRNTLFWNDNWCGSESFKNMFPRLYMLESNKDALVSDRIISDSSISATATDSFSAAETAASVAASFRAAAASVSAGLHLNWSWSCDPTGRTSDELTEIENLLKSFHFDFNARESWKWVLSDNGVFMVKKLSSLLDVHILGIPNVIQKMMRNNLVPKKLEIFVWWSLKKRIPVRMELDKRGIDLHSVRCPVCDDDLESVDHSLVRCKFALDVWARIHKWWNFGNHSFSDVDILEGKVAHSSTALGQKLWQAVVWNITLAVAAADATTVTDVAALLLMPPLLLLSGLKRIDPNYIVTRNKQCRKISKRLDNQNMKKKNIIRKNGQIKLKHGKTAVEIRKFARTFLRSKSSPGSRFGGFGSKPISLLLLQLMNTVDRLALTVDRWRLIEIVDRLSETVDRLSLTVYRQCCVGKRYVKCQFFSHYGA